MDFINMTSTGKATIEVDVREFNRMVLNCTKLTLLQLEYMDYGMLIDQMEQANNFKE